MIRTQIYIEDTTHQKLRRLSDETTKPVATIIRDFINEGLQQSKDIEASGKKALTEIARLGFKGGGPKLSENIDYYLYGDPQSR